MKVLVVDDSVVYRTQIAAALRTESELEVVGTASSGKLALQRLEQGTVDVVTVDLEMPEMSGIELIREMRMRRFPVKIIVFSSQTLRGAEAALEALRSGADDVVPKIVSSHTDLESVGESIRQSLVPRILQFRSAPATAPAQPTKVLSGAADGMRRDLRQTSFQAAVIASSTGGPNALEEIFKELRGPLLRPIFLVQHMPPVFTQILARRLSEASGLQCAEAVDGEKVSSHRVYIAPGGFHLEVHRSTDGLQCRLTTSPPRNSVRPAADYLFETAAKIYGPHLLGVVLTGMGEDGAAGAAAIKEQGGGIAIQNKESCTVFGMPGAVFRDANFDEIADLKRVSALLQHACC